MDMANNTNQSALSLTVDYETACGSVKLTSEDVRKYLVRGGGNITDQEIKLFLELCKYQKLNPFVGEAYPIKFGSEFQLVVGYEAYKRRAEENPAYAGRKAGITVLRGDEVIQKEGTCLYPKEELIGGWCRVYRDRNGRIEETFKEVSLKEYDKNQANWKTKPCMMIEKVAVSQALRAMFPTDCAGLYIPEEAGTSGYNTEVINVESQALSPNHSANDDPVITNDQRQKLFSEAKAKFADKANGIVSGIISELGFSSTSNMPTSVWNKAMARIGEYCDPQTHKPQPDESQSEEPWIEESDEEIFCAR
jgi:phage recombination protein Bet